MSSVFRVQNLFAAQGTVSGDIVFDRTDDLTLTAVNQTGAGTATIPNLVGVSQDILLTSQTQTVTNKTIGTSTILSTTEIGDSTNSTKQVAFDIAGATASTATTLDFNQTVNRTITFPDATGTVNLVPSGTDEQLIRMDGTTSTQASSVTLGDTGALANVLSVGGTAAASLTLSSQTGQTVVLTSDTNVRVTNTASVGGLLTLDSNLVFNETTNDLTVAAVDQAIGAATATIPDLGGVSQNFLFTTQTQTVTNKTIGASTILSTTEIGDSTDSTKQVAFDIAGATASTATTLDFNQTVNRTITFPDATGTVGLFSVLGTDNQLIRMDGSNAIQASTVVLTDTNILQGVRSITGEAAQPLSLLPVAGQTIVLTSDTNVAITNNASVGGNLTVTGNLVVDGTTTSVNSTVVTIADNNLLLSSNYTTAAARPGGFTVNYLPTATTSAYTATTTTTLTTTTNLSGSLVIGDIILVTGDAIDSNNGLYEVAGTPTATVVTIKSSPVYNFLQTGLSATTSTGTLHLVTVAVLQAGTDGAFEVARGSNTSMVFVDLQLVGASTWTDVTLQTINATLTTAVTINPTNDKSTFVEYNYTARENGASASNCGSVERTFYDVAGAVTAMGIGVWSYGNFGGSSATWVTGANASGANILIQVTGAAATTIDWKIRYRYLESQ